MKMKKSDLIRLITEETIKFVEELEATDSPEVEDLYLYIKNDGELYKRLRLPIENKLTSKKQDGSYDPEKAIKLFLHLAKMGSQKYLQEMGVPEKGGFSEQDRYAVAKGFLDDLEAQWSENQPEQKQELEEDIEPTEETICLYKELAKQLGLPKFLASIRDTLPDDLLQAMLQEIAAREQALVAHCSRKRVSSQGPSLGESTPARDLGPFKQEEYGSAITLIHGLESDLGLDKSESINNRQEFIRSIQRIVAEVRKLKAIEKEYLKSKENPLAEDMTEVIEPGEK